MQLLNVIPSETYSKDGHQMAKLHRGKNATEAGEYSIAEFKKHYSDGSGAGETTYFPGRGAEIIWHPPNGGQPIEIGTMGIVNPAVLDALKLKNPVSILEITLDHFVDFA